MIKNLCPNEQCEVYILTCEYCNGEYGEAVHLSVHVNLEDAKQTQADNTPYGHLKGEDAPNEWRQEKPGVWQFRTGNWGYIVWKIRQVTVSHGPVGPVPGSLANPILTAEPDQKFAPDGAWCICSRCGDRRRAVGIFDYEAETIGGKLICSKCMETQREKGNG